MKSINRNIWYLGWVSFWTDLASSITTTLLPLFVVYILDEGVDKLGIVIAVATFVSYAFRILFGYVSQRYALVKPLVVAGYLVSALTKPMLALVQGYGGVALVRAVERMGKAVRSAPKDALISAYSEKKKAGRTFGFHKTLDIAGELAGAGLVSLLLLFFVLDDRSIRWIFAGTLLPGLVGLYLLIRKVEDVPQPRLASGADDGKPGRVWDPRDRALLPMLLVYFLAVLFMLSDQYLIVRAKETGFADAVIPLLVMVSTLTQTLTSYYSGVLRDRIGSQRLLLYALLAAIGSVFLLRIGWIWPGFVLFGLFTVVSLNAMRAYIAEQAQSTAFVFGLFYGGVALFGALGALIMGQIWERWDFDTVAQVSLAGLVLLSLYLAARCSRCESGG